MSIKDDRLGTNETQLIRRITLFEVHSSLLVLDNCTFDWTRTPKQALLHPLDLFNILLCTNSRVQIFNSQFLNLQQQPSKDVNAVN